MDPILLKLNKEIAEKYGVSENLVKYVVDYVFTDVRNHIKEGSPQSVLLHYFGSFNLSDKSLYKIKEKFVSSYKKGNIKKLKYRKGLKNLEELIRKYEYSNQQG
jgi:nucleoid DNA-binding protein